MPCWIAWPIPDPQQAGCWADTALTFTPRVTLDVPGVLLMEVKDSRRLFGGEEALLRRLAQAWPDMQGEGGIVGGRGQTGHAALACLQGRRHAAGWAGHWQGPSARWLDPLPCTALQGWQAQEAWLSTLGVRTIGQLRALPRSGLARRLGPDLLRVLDQALGRVPEVWNWVPPAERFELWREFDGRREQATALLAEVQPMLDQLVGWLAQRQSGVSSLSLHWRLDHARGEPAEDGLTLNLAQPSRDRRRLERLLQERLDQAALKRPALGLTLRTLQVARLTGHAGSLFVHAQAPEGAQWQDPEVLRTAAGQREQTLRCEVLLEQLSTRLGPQQVLRGALVADHRPEKAQRWWPAHEVDRPRPGPGPGRSTSAPRQRPASARDLAEEGRNALPLPTWLLDPPRALPWQAGPLGLQPAWQGALQPLTGPHRIATAWWDPLAQGGTLRDYHLMHSPQAGLVWVCRDRPVNGTTGPAPGPGPSPWQLHGLFA